MVQKKLNLSQYVPRRLEEKLNHWLTTKHILAILGPRQVGKTTLLMRLAQKTGGTYITLEDLETYELFTNDIVSFAKQYKDSKILFIDEIQYAPNAGKYLKYLFDVHGFKMVVAGSVSDEVKTKLSKYLVGRAIFFYLYPFDLLEYAKAAHKIRPEETAPKAAALYLKELSVDLTNFDKDPARYVEQLKAQRTALKFIKKLATEYLQYGGYPDVVFAKDAQQKLQILKGILETVLRRDLMSYFGFNNALVVYNFLKYVAAGIGSPLSINGFTGEYSISYRTAVNILDKLMRTFILGLCTPFVGNPQTEVKRAKKVYFIDTGIPNALTPVDYAKLVENYVFTTLIKKDIFVHYWRTKQGGEVDFVFYNEQKELVAVEVKSGIQKSLGQPRYSFMRKYKPKYMFLLNDGHVDTFRYEDTTIVFLPWYLVV